MQNKDPSLLVILWINRYHESYTLKKGDARLIGALTLITVLIIVTLACYYMHPATRTIWGGILISLTALGLMACYELASLQNWKMVLRNIIPYYPYKALHGRWCKKTKAALSNAVEHENPLLTPQFVDTNWVAIKHSLGYNDPASRYRDTDLFHALQELRKAGQYKRAMTGWHNGIDESLTKQLQLLGLMQKYVHNSDKPLTKEIMTLAVLLRAQQAIVNNLRNTLPQ